MSDCNLIPPSLVTEKKSGGDIVGPSPTDGLDSISQLVEAVRILSFKEPLKVLEKELVLHQKVDVRAVEAAEIES